MTEQTEQDYTATLYDNLATVTIQRGGGEHGVAITVGFKFLGGQWFITDILSENGEEMYLTKTEELLARSLVTAGVDETGR